MTNEVAKPATSPAKAMKTFLETNAVNILKGLSQDINPEKFMATVYNLLLVNPNIAQCDKMTVLNAVNRSAQLGLSPDPMLGESYFIPRDKKEKQGNQWVSVGKTCDFQIGYKGLIKIAYASNFIKLMQSYTVYDNDHLIMEAGLKPDYRVSRGTSRGEIEGFLCMVKLENDEWDFEYMSVADVNRVRDKSDAYKASSKYGSDSPWTSSYEEMGKKTVIKRLFKRLPKLDDYDVAVEYNNVTPQEAPQPASKFKPLEIKKQEPQPQEIIEHIETSSDDFISFDDDTDTENNIIQGDLNV
jgi:recombination protein RecT